MDLVRGAVGVSDAEDGEFTQRVREGALWKIASAGWRKAGLSRGW